MERMKNPRATKPSASFHDNPIAMILLANCQFATEKQSDIQYPMKLMTVHFRMDKGTGSRSLFVHRTFPLTKLDSLCGIRNRNQRGEANLMVVQVPASEQTAACSMTDGW